MMLSAELQVQDADFVRTPTEAARALILDDLRLLAANPSLEVRRQFAMRFGCRYDELIGDGVSELANVVLELLVRDVEWTVREALAKEVAASACLPVEVALKLARDDIMVAGPILRMSPLLDEEQIMDIVSSCPPGHSAIIASRTDLTARLIGVLIDGGQSQVVANLLDNQQAPLSPDTLSKLVSDYGHDRDIQERLMRRSGLPPELVDRMVSMIGQQLEWEMIESRSINAHEAQRLMSLATQRAARSLKSASNQDRMALTSIHQRLIKGELTQMDILAYLRDGEFTNLESALAAMARLDVASVKRLLYHLDKRALAALCLRARIGTPQYLAIRMAFDLMDRGIQNHATGRIAYPEKTLRFVQDQYDRLRKDKGLIRQFL